MSLKQAYIIGGDGQIGRALGDALGRQRIPVVATTRRAVLSGGGSEFLDLEGEIAAWRPRGPGGIAFLCAGATNLDACRINPAATRHINVEQTVALARVLAAGGYRPVLFSTNMVFDGRSLLPTPQDTPCPVSEYGRQKYDAERLLLEQVPGALVIRLGKVIPPEMALFKHWLAQWRRGEVVRAFSDLHLAPLPLSTLLEATLGLATGGAEGLWHLSPSAQCSYVQAAHWLACRVGCGVGLVETATAQDAGIPPEHRPRYVALDSAATETFCGLRLPSPQEALATVCCAC